jgi:hypothetical protein
LGGCGLLLPGERRSREIDPKLRAWPELHARLALVEATGAPPVVPRSQRGDVFWVTAGSRPPRRGALGAARNRYLISPEPIAAAEVAFSVAGCAAQELDRARWQRAREEARSA